MALPRQTFELTFTEGVDTNVDPKLVLPSKLLSLENGVFRKGGKIQKRYGYSSISNTLVDINNNIGSLSEGTSLNTYLDELLCHTNNQLISYAQGRNAWYEKGNISPFIVSSKEVIHDSLSKTNIDMALSDDLELYAYENEDSPYGLYMTVVDTHTEVAYQYNSLLSITGTKPRCLNVLEGLFVVYLDYADALAAAATFVEHIRTTMNTHAASFGPAPQAHSAADNVNFPVAAVTITNIEDLITLTTNLQIAYTAHNDDANLGAAWLYHIAQQAGNDLTVAAPTDIFTCVAALNDLKAQYNGHKSSVVSHNAVVGTVSLADITAYFDLKLAKISLTNPAAAPTIYLLSNNTSDGLLMDAVATGTTLAVLWSTTSSSMLLGRFSQLGGTLGLPAAINPKVSGGAIFISDTGLALKHNVATNTLWVFGFNTGLGLYGGVYSILLAELLPMTLIDSYITLPITNITAEFLDDVTAQVFYETSNSGVTARELNHIKCNTLTQAGVAGAITDSDFFLRNAGLVCKAWKYNDTIYVGASYQSPQNNGLTGGASGDLQPTNFICGASLSAPYKASVRGKFLNLAGHGYVNQLALTTIKDSIVYVTSEKSVMIKDTDASKTATVTPAIGITRSVAGLAKVEFDFDSPYKHFIETINNIAYMTGGQLEIYDGAQVVEAGFHVYPEGFVSTINALSGNVPAEVLYYCFVWKWYDRRGNLHRSAPSPTFEIDNSGGIGTESISITIPTLGLTNKTGVYCEAYRVSTGGTTFYKLGEVLNDKDAEIITFEDVLNDAAIEQNEFLYTTGGVLEHISPPSVKILTQWKNRLWILGEDNYLWYTNEQQDNTEMWFNDFVYRVPLDLIGGIPTAITAMDNNLILFKPLSIYFTNIRGANVLGTDASAIDIQLITSDAGCENPNSIVMMPKGLMFKSNKGIYLLDRGFNVDYVGAPVSLYNTNEVFAASSHPDQNEARFLIDNNMALVYNYFFNQWCVFTNIVGIDAVNWDSKYVYLRADNKVMYEDSTKYLDGGASIRLKIETAWIKTAGIQGFQRIYWTHFLGTREDVHKLRVELSYNYNDALVDMVEFDPALTLNTSVYGDDAFYGDAEYYGGSSDQVYQFRHKPRIQKCESLKCTIYDTESSGAGFALNHLLLTIGVKTPDYKLKTTKTISS